MKKNIILVIFFIFIICFIYFFPKKKEVKHFEISNQAFQVTIDGAVNFPGIYTIKSGVTLGYLINLAGGLTNYANISHIDLTQMLDKDYYFIESYEKITYDPIIKKNLNDISYEELLNIPYINEDKALEILMYRKQNQGFKSVDELLNIKGIGEKTLDKIKAYFTV